MPPATKIENSITPAQDNYKFGPFSYTNLLKDLTLETEITVDIKYEIDSNALATACVAHTNTKLSEIQSNCGKKQNLQVQQQDLPLKISSLSAKSGSPSEIILPLYMTNILSGFIYSRILL